MKTAKGFIMSRQLLSDTKKWGGVIALTSPDGNNNRI